MSIKIDDATRRDLEEFWRWIQKEDEQWFQKYQEQIFTIFSLLINQAFRVKISHLRDELSIPKEWYTTRKNDDLLFEYSDYNDSNPDKALKSPHDKRITNICRELHIDIKRYYDFIVDYMNFGHPWVLITPHYEYFEHFHAEDEYRYKANIELDYGEGKQKDLSNTPQKAYIQFYKDTTPNQIIEFIKNNTGNIINIQKNLPNYPHRKKYEHFKRDLQVYLLYLLGNSSLEIPSLLIERNVPDDESEVAKMLMNEYAVEDPHVHIIIKEIEQRIAEIFK